MNRSVMALLLLFDYNKCCQHCVSNLSIVPVADFVRFGPYLFKCCHGHPNVCLSMGSEGSLQSGDFFSGHTSDVGHRSCLFEVTLTVNHWRRFNLS